jgi:hypothetical protein
MFQWRFKFGVSSDFNKNLLAFRADTYTESMMSYTFADATLPIIDGEDIVHERMSGDTLTLTCEASAQPAPTITWNTNGIVVES